jgi:hypothetical protein
MNTEKNDNHFPAYLDNLALDNIAPVDEHIRTVELAEITRIEAEIEKEA